MNLFDKSLIAIAVFGLCTASEISAEEKIKDLPQDRISTVYKSMKDWPPSKDERIAHWKKLLNECRQVRKDNPGVPNTTVYGELIVRRLMLPLAERIYVDQKNEDNRNALKDIAEETLSIPVYKGHQIHREKVHAAAVLAKLAIYRDDNSTVENADPYIRSIINHFTTGDDLEKKEAFIGQAYIAAADLAIQLKKKELADEFCKEIENKYSNEKGAVAVLINGGFPPVFKATLKTLDGREINLPADTKGKVVLVDFWATWCGPCVQSMPHIKKVHEKYKDKGVQVIGISCDHSKESSKEAQELNMGKVIGFVQDNGYNWTQTYSGSWPEAAVKYGVSSIPAVMVIGKDGRIFSANARGREEKIIDEALKVKYSQETETKNLLRAR